MGMMPCSARPARLSLLNKLRAWAPTRGFRVALQAKLYAVRVCRCSRAVASDWCRTCPTSRHTTQNESWHRRIRRLGRVSARMAANASCYSLQPVMLTNTFRTDGKQIIFFLFTKSNFAVNGVLDCLTRRCLQTCGMCQVFRRGHMPQQEHQLAARSGFPTTCRIDHSRLHPDSHHGQRKQRNTQTVSSGNETHHKGRPGAGLLQRKPVLPRLVVSATRHWRHLLSRTGCGRIVRNEAGSLTSETKLELEQVKGANR